MVYKLIYAQPAPKELERKFEEASESESVDTNTSERSTLRDCVRTGPQDEMDRSSNSTGQNISFIISRTLNPSILSMVSTSAYIRYITYFLSNTF